MQFQRQDWGLRDPLPFLAQATFLIAGSSYSPATQRCLIRTSVEKPMSLMSLFQLLLRPISNSVQHPLSIPLAITKTISDERKRFTCYPKRQS